MTSMNASAIAHYKSAERAMWSHFGIAPKDRFLELQRPRLRVRVQEHGTGPTTLFLHGSPNAGSVWAPLVARLCGLGCFLLDRPGCGLSEACDYRSGSLRSLAVEVIDSTLDQLGVDRATLVCSSLGGLWGFWYAMARPARVTKLIQLSCPAGIKGGRVPLFLRLLSVPGLNRVLFALQPPSIKSTRAILQQVCGQNLALVPPAIIDWGTCLYVHTHTLQNELRLIEQVGDLRGMKARARLSDDEIAGIAAPTLFVWANNDPFGSAELGRRVAQRMPAASLRILDSGGHLPWLDDPRSAPSIFWHFSLRAGERRVDARYSARLARVLRAASSGGNIGRSPWQLSFAPRFRTRLEALRCTNMARSRLVPAPVNC